MQGKVVKIIADLFFVLCGEKVYECSARGKLKKDKIVVGDDVEFDLNENIIEKVGKRRNILIRPPVSNIDKMLIVLASIPEPDFILIDKLIVKCFKYNITPYIVINKCDINNEQFIKNVHEEYDGVVEEVVEISALTKEGVENLINKIKGSVTCLAGQSAVGKSELTLAFGGKAEVGELSKKINRGKNTTRHCEINILESGVMTIDTPGFSRLELEDVKYTELMTYYPDFYPYLNECKFTPCTHKHEKEQDCGVKRAVNVCKINKNRYNRYIEIYDELKTYWEKMYD